MTMSEPRAAKTVRIESDTGTAYGRKAPTWRTELKEHRSVLAAVRRRDAALASDRLRDHLRGARAKLLDRQPSRDAR